jgi:CRISPR-associated protein Csc2
LKGNKEELDFPLVDAQVLDVVHEATNMLLSQVVGRMPGLLRGDVLDRALDETISLYRNPEDVRTFLEEIDRDYARANK